ncbi:MAG: flagellar motor switch phosphatase FliY [Lachnospiraceae bacterium]|nr:flagellar motor switch phosphatase FliY [Lachnospiraceae bacterium]
MDGMLSQDEINALLSGMDLSGDEAPDMSGIELPVAEDKPPTDPYLINTQPVTGGDELLSEVERDAIGEVANISMGSSATTLYSLVNRKVNITTPVVTLCSWETLLQEFERPCVFIRIKYTKGLDGTDILVLKENDVKVITDLMMGGDGTNTEGELGELHLSAISEAMNQMMGSSATSLSTMLGTMIDISPPESSLLNLQNFEDGSEISPFLGGTFCRITFRMQIGEDLVDSTIMQLYPIEFAKKIVETFMGSQGGGAEEAPAPEPAPAPAPTPAPAPGPAPGPMPGMGQPAPDMSQMGYGQPMGMPQMGYGQPMPGMPPMGYGQPMQGMPQMGYAPVQPMNIQPASFQSFSGDLSGVQGGENIGLIMDVPLEVTVELGRTTKSISDILNFAPGTIIELDRIAGEPIDVLVNGKFVAKGEVVVIEENFGIRVTEIIKQ